VGGSHCLVLCTDGSLATWGLNYSGQLGNGQTSIPGSLTPILVNPTGALTGKTVSAIACGSNSSFALCTDGTLVGWGHNSTGQLGDNTDNNLRTSPVAVATTNLRVGERFVGVVSGGSHTLGVTVMPPPPTLETLTASSVGSSAATLNGTVNAAGGSASVAFEYGTSTAYGTTVAATPGIVNGVITAAVGKSITGLIAGAIYHYRVVATYAGGTVKGVDQTFVTGNPPTFADYAISTPFQTAATVPLRKLLAKTSDPDGDTFTVTVAGPASANGGTVALLPDSIRYTPANNFSGTDAFPVTITDAGGTSVAGTVTVTVGQAPNAGGVGVNPPTLTTLPDGKMAIAFYGIPGRSYIVQRSVSGLDNWVTLATISADASGKVSYTDESPPAGSAFYRLGLP
jgi:hypothetical protein